MRARRRTWRRTAPEGLAWSGGEVGYFFSFRPKPAMPDPVGQPDVGTTHVLPSCLPTCTGAGDTD